MFKQRIQADIKEAMKEKNQSLVGVLRLAAAALQAKEKEKRYKLSKEKPGISQEELVKQSALSDDESIAVIVSEIKKRQDATALYEQGNRPELAEQEKQEIDIFKKYLPEQLSADELQKLIAASIAKTGAVTIKDMGKVMADLAPAIKGKADNRQVSEIIKMKLHG